MKDSRQRTCPLGSVRSSADPWWTLRAFQGINRSDFGDLALLIDTPTRDSQPDRVRQLLIPS